tara:strand:+ start:1456 stop:3717 length:2262 start_codon:yes stop_codon:yes gene_type:complete
MSKKIKFKSKLILTYLFIFIMFPTYLLADVIKKFEISGNDRISSETIILFSGYKLEENIGAKDLNKIIKNLYETSFFKNIDLNFEKNILMINVEENPLIQSIIFKGIKRASLVEKLKDILIQKEKSSFIKNKIKDDQNKIINSLRVSGYYFADVSVKFKENDNNTVDIIYSVDLGDKALIKNIKFIGNKIFKDNKLRKVIVSEEAKFWKFVSTKKNVDIQRFKLDENLLKNFYKNNGFYDVKINSTFAQLIKDNYFDVIFSIDAGDKYFFNDIELNLPIEYNRKDFVELDKILKDLKSRHYSLNRIEDILDEIDKIALNNNYEFISASYDEKIIEKNKINLSINLKDSEKYYIQKINITGNNVTSETVIRNQFLADEGDPFNELLINKSYNNVRALRIFKDIETIIDTDEAKKMKVINVKVKEKPTGEIFAGAGTGTSGSSVSFGISENNYLGEGIRLGADLSLSDDVVNGKFFLSEPNYKNSDRSFVRGIERTEIDHLSNFGYKTEKTGFTFGTQYEQFKNIFFSPNLSNYYEKISTNSQASSAKKKQDGNYLDVIFDYSLSLNKLNQNFNPSEGYKVIFSQELPLYSDDFTLVNKFNYSTYYQTNNNTIYSFAFFTALSNSLSNDDARITKRVFIPPKKLRGFEPGKIGPKDGSDHIGGNFGSAINFTSTLPNFLTEVQDLDFSLFLDAANVWGVDYDSNLDGNNKIRSSTGVALDWFTPIGPLSLSYAIPLTKDSSDVTENFRFNIGTTF